MVVDIQEREPNSDTLVLKVARELRQRVIERGLKENDLFMTEAEVAAEFNVSRGVAREAVSRLRAIGALKSRQAKGLLIGRSDPVQLMAESLPFCVQEPGDLHSLAQLRYVLEVGSVDLIVRRATEEQIAALGEIAEEFARAEEELQDSSVEEQHIRSGQIDLAFHRLMLEMTNSPMLMGMHNVLADFFAAATAQGPSVRFTLAGSAQMHWPIVEAIELRDVELCRALLRNHLRKLMEEGGEGGRGEGGKLGARS